MEKSEEQFELTYNNHSIQLQMATVQQQVVFRITFPDKTPPLIIGRITNIHGQKVWSSFPEGRMREAQEIGALIVAWYKAKQ